MFLHVIILVMEFLHEIQLLTCHIYPSWKANMYPVELRLAALAQSLLFRGQSQAHRVVRKISEGSPTLSPN